MTEPLTTRTVKVFVRHSATCKDKNRGGEWRRCNCRKILRIYEGGGSGRNRVQSAKTRSWEKAETFAQEWLDSFDPEKQELKRLRAAKERQQVTVEEAVALYCADMIARLGDSGTVAMARSLFGHINPETKAISKTGHLFDWLHKQVERPTLIGEITSAHLTAWRASWAFGDLTARQRWSMVKGFFTFCEIQGWIPDSPARKLKPLLAAKGSRTAIFTDAQYSAILDSVNVYDPENVPVATRKAWQQRLTTFLELMRWSGMDLTDAVQYRPESVDKDGVLRYRRQKTKVLATIPLPEHLIVLLRDIPLERDSVGPSQPFRQTDCKINSDTRTWAHRLETLFALAEITEVRTDQRTRTPHAKMLRDTFAVWHLRHGAKLHTVAKMLGHSKTATTEQAYLPWVKELEEAHIDDARKSLAQAKPKAKGNRVVSITKPIKSA